MAEEKTLEKQTYRFSSGISVYSMTVMALMTAVTCILAPMSVPIGPIPVSLTNLVLCFSIILLGKKKATISFFIYLLIGCVGVPVFSGFTGGVGRLVGPTGGYLIGFLFLAWIGGIYEEKYTGKPLWYAVGMVLGTICLYAFGTIWYLILMKTDLWSALTVCVFPFLIFDAVKILLACTLGETIRRRLKY